MNPFQAAWSWLMAKEVRVAEPDDVIPLRVCRTFQEAHELTELLHHSGLKAEIFADDTSDRSAGAGFTEFGQTPWGVRVMIVAGEAEQAVDVLADYEEELQRRYRERA